MKQDYRQHADPMRFWPTARLLPGSRFLHAIWAWL